MSRIVVSLRGDKEVRKLLDSLSGQELQNRTRRATRAGAAVMRVDLRRRARSGRYPESFRKIATRSSTRGGIKTQVGPVSPLHNIFEGGAGVHAIAPRGPGSIRRSRSGVRSVVDTGSRGVLSNPDAGFFSATPVRHPGMAARPLTTPAFEATKDAAAEAAIDKLLEGLR